ncbi:MAG: hypothetical protein ACLP1X_11830 [Polyangiaceae bacterium]
MAILLALGCGGRVAGNGSVDSSTGTDASGGTAVGGSSDGPSVEGSVTPVSGSMSDGATVPEKTGADIVDAGPMTEAGRDSGTCMTNTDCSGGYLCGFDEGKGCPEPGTCFPPPDAMCAAVELHCACDGTSINLVCNGLPGGYTLKPIPFTDVTYTGDCEWAVGIEPRN